jgi:membrane fusion protein (multidrug efflux system)
MICKKNNTLGYVTIIFLIVGLIGCGGSDQTGTDVSERAISVKGEIVTISTKELKKSFTGTLEGEKHAVITAKIAEAVEKVTVDEGTYVKADDVLVRLDRTGPTSNYVQASSVYQNAEKNYKKMVYLFEEGAVSESQFDGAKTEYEVAKANFDAARKLVDLRTPVAGMVTSIGVSAGDYLYAGQTVATVAAVDRLRMKLGVSSNDIGFFELGADVEVLVGSASELRAYGKVARVAQSADPVTRTFQVEIEIDNKVHTLKPGMFARARTSVEKYENVIVIPRNAVMDRDNKTYVFVVSDGNAKMTEIIMGAEFDGSVIIKRGLAPGDTLITIGQDYLDDGYSVKLVRLVNAEGKEIEL